MPYEKFRTESILQGSNDSNINNEVQRIKIKHEYLLVLIIFCINLQKKMRYFGIIALMLICLAELKSQCTNNFYPAYYVVPPPDTANSNNPFGCDNTLGFNSIDYSIGINNCVSLSFYVIETPNLPTTFPIFLNYIDIKRIEGLPSGLSFTCSSSDCRFYRNSYGCVNICGIPSSSGYFPVKIIADINVNSNPSFTIQNFDLFGNQLSMDSSYVIFVQDPLNPSTGCRLGNEATGITPLSKSELGGYISDDDILYLNNALSGYIEIADLQGKIVFAKNLQQERITPINKSVTKGVYIITFVDKRNTIRSRKLIKR